MVPEMASLSNSKRLRMLTLLRRSDLKLSRRPIEARSIIDHFAGQLLTYQPEAQARGHRAVFRDRRSGALRRRRGWPDKSPWGARGSTTPDARTGDASP